jgi:threonine dehydrogenase-like Zn-dependent dehydrogenase
VNRVVRLIVRMQVGQQVGHALDGLRGRHNCRNGGIVSIIGVYGGFPDKIPMGSAMNRGLTFRMGQTHMQRYMRPLLKRIEPGEIDPSFVITHKTALEDGPDMYQVFRDKQDGCVKVVLTP